MQTSMFQFRCLNEILCLNFMISAKLLIQFQCEAFFLREAGDWVKKTAATNFSASEHVDDIVA